MIRIGEYEEHVLKDGNEELLEESVRGPGIGFRNIGDQLKTHIESSILDFAIVMLACPHAGIDDKLELSVIELEKCYLLSVVVHVENILDSPGKQWRLMARSKLKNSTRCSGNSEKSLLIISNVHSNTFSMMMGTWSSMRDYLLKLVTVPRGIGERYI